MEGLTNSGSITDKELAPSCNCRSFFLNFLADIYIVWVSLFMEIFYVPGVYMKDEIFSFGFFLSGFSVFTALGVTLVLLESRKGYT